MSSESTAGSFPAVIKQVTVPLGPQAALDLFTAGMDRWWPFESHSVYEGKHLSFRFECRVGGQLVETGPDGQESVWGTVESVKEPNSVVFTWHPGRGPEAAQTVEMTFAPSPDGTSVTLVHRGWDTLGDRAEAVRGDYETGWDIAFVARFGGAAQAAGDQ